MTRELALLDTFIDSFFFNFPKDTGKPPVDIHVFKDELKKFHIQIALAGYTEEDVQVSVEGKVLKVEGDNTLNDKVSPKFRCKFQKIWTVQDGYDLESATVSFSNGLLDICIQEKEKPSLKKLLYGKDCNNLPYGKTQT